MKERRIGMMTRLISMIFLPVLVITGVAMVMAQNSLSTGLEKEALHGMELLARAVAGSYDSLEGEYRVEGDTLFKGDTNLSESLGKIGPFCKGNGCGGNTFLRGYKIPDNPDGCTGAAGNRNESRREGMERGKDRRGISAARACDCGNRSDLYSLLCAPS